MTSGKLATLVGLALVLVVLILASGRNAWVTYRAWRQAQMNGDLITAIQRGDAVAVETLLEQGADPNTKDSMDRRTPSQYMRDLFLHRSTKGRGTTGTGRLALVLVPREIPGFDEPAWKRSQAMYKALMNHGARADIKDPSGVPALLWISLFVDNRLVQMALAHGAKVDAQDRLGWTPLMSAAVCQDADRVRILLAHGANVNLKNDFGDTALITAVVSGRRVGRDGMGRTRSAAIVKMLLERGALVNVAKNTPLKIALWAHRPDLVALLKRYEYKQ